MKKELNELLSKKRELQYEISRIDEELQEMIANFNGTLVEAIALGLVKPAFATTKGFRNYISETTQV